MQRLLTVLLIVVVGTAGGAAAQTPVNAQLEGRIAGATMRGQIWSEALNQNHLWRFRPDGTVSGTFTANVLAPQTGKNFIEISDEGTWRVADGRLCVEWHRFFYGAPQCFALSSLRPGWVRFTNLGDGPSFDAQLSR